MFFKKEWVVNHRPWASVETCPDEHRQARFILLCIFQTQFSSVSQSCSTLCNPMDCSTLGFPVRQQLPELAQNHVHPVGDAIQKSHPLWSPSPSAFNFSQHQGLFQCQFFAAGGQNIGVSASASVLSMNIQK